VVQAASGGKIVNSAESGGGDVRGSDGPPVACEPASVTIVPSAQVKGPTGPVTGRVDAQIGEGAVLGAVSHCSSFVA
jgi:hypothetical protein